MTTTTTELDAREALAGRLVDGLTQAMELFGVYLGVELGLYRALDELGSATEAELAGQAGPGTRANGSSSRPSPATSPATTRPSRRSGAGSGCPRATPRSWSTPTVPSTRRR
jgi:hypothetical protein